MKALITGGHGFIGRHLQEQCRAAGLSFSLFEGDVRNPVTSSDRFDAVVHLAGKRDAPSPGQIAAGTSSGNLQGVQNMLDFCVQNRARLIFSSTCGVYQSVHGVPQHENSPVAAKTAYAQEKLHAERLCESYHNRHEIDVSVLRIFNVYGPGQNQEFFVSYLLNQSLAGRRLKINHPDSVRDFIHVADVASAIIALLRIPISGHKVFNVGTGRGHTIAESIRILQDLMGKKIEYDTPGVTASDPIPFSVADIAKTRDALHWSPTIAFRQGLESMRHSL